MSWDEMVEMWFRNITKHARENYEKNGWDNFVECVGMMDFKRDAHDYDWQHESDAFEHYQEWCALHQEMDEDMRAEAW